LNYPKIISGFALVVAIAFAGSGQASAPDSRREWTAQVETFEKDFSAALAHNDVDSLGQLLSKDYKIISGDGSFITKARFLSVLNSGALKHDTMTFDARSIRIYDKVAVVTEHARSGGSYQGAAFRTDEISTDIIINTNGRLICVLTQLTTIVPK
jgi:hypothetical protein